MLRIKESKSLSSIKRFPVNKFQINSLFTQADIIVFSIQRIPIILLVCKEKVN